MSNVIMILAVISGPIAAVLITLWSQKKSAIRERQLMTLRMLLNTRHLPSDPSYSAAVNMVPLEFNKQAKVMSAWKRYIEVVHTYPTAENRNRHDQEIDASQTNMIYEILQHLGYDISETDLQTSAYASQGFAELTALGVRSQVAMVRIANALEAQNAEAGLPDPQNTEQIVKDNKLKDGKAN